MARTCDFRHGECDQVATTTLMKASGEIVPLCELHYEAMVYLMKAISEGRIKNGDKDWTVAADHWFVLNKIPI